MFTRMSAAPDLAALAREREARRGTPARPATTSRIGAPTTRLGTVGGWKLLALILTGWAAIAWTQRSSCGCGKAHSLEGALEGALGGLGAMLSGKKSLDGTLEEMGKGLEKLGESCESKLSSSMCYTACWMAGMELQRRMWW